MYDEHSFDVGYDVVCVSA